MIKIVPHTIDYKYLQRVNKGLKTLLYASATTATITFLLNIFHLLPEYNEILQITLNSFTCIFALAYFTLNIAFNYFFQQAEVIRRKDFIDNSLGTKLSEKNSVGYYSNESNSTGIVKLGLNCFENSLFTSTIVTKMLFPMWRKTAIVLVGFLCLALFTNNRTLTTVLQLALPLTIIQQSIKLYIFRNSVKRIYEEFYTIFSSTSGIHLQNLIIRNVISYESTLAWGAVLVDSKIYDEVNPELSLVWDDIKTRLNLNAQPSNN
jgi:hypothetical protein